MKNDNIWSTAVDLKVYKQWTSFSFFAPKYSSKEWALNSIYNKILYSTSHRVQKTNELNWETYCEYLIWICARIRLMNEIALQTIKLWFPCFLAGLYDSFHRLPEKLIIIFDYFVCIVAHSLQVVTYFLYYNVDFPGY